MVGRQSFEPEEESNGRERDGREVQLQCDFMHELKIA
jgi:hypothetical protein